jgi:hypothetical protein
MPIGPCKYRQGHMRVVLIVGPVGWLFTDGSPNKRQLANRQAEDLDLMQGQATCAMLVRDIPH